LNYQNNYVRRSSC